MKLNYYARLNDENVAIEIISTPNNLDGVKGYKNIVDYNETLLYKKWDDKNGWSSKSYEPTLDTVIQDRLDLLERDNTSLSDTIQLLEGTITELMMVIGGMQQ